MDGYEATISVIRDSLTEGGEGKPLYERLADAVDALVLRGKLAPGVRLPSTRDLASAVGWHRSTVIQAYRELARRGSVEAGVGRGTFIKELARRPARPRGSFPWTEVYPQEEGALEVEDVLARDIPFPSGSDPIRLSGAVPDPSLFPVDDLRTVLGDVLKQNGPSALGYGPTEGLLSLREVIAERLRAQGIPASAERILIVQGSQQGLDLVARRLVRSGDLLALESPTYANALTLFRKLGLQMVPIPMDGEGIRPDVLERVASRESIRLLYTMPSFQNPTGLTQSVQRRKDLLEVAVRCGIPILEDHFDAELRFRGEPLPALKSMDTTDQVLLLGTFSKILFPGLRVGWLLVPEPIYDSLKHFTRATSLSTSVLTQEILAEFCRRGLLDQHLQRVCKAYASRRKTLLESMGEFFPPETTWTRPEDGGMTLLVTLPPRLNAVSVALEARRQGVHVAPGPFFFVEGGHGNLSLSSTAEPEGRLREGVRRLGNILKKAVAEAGTGPSRDREEAPLI